LCTQDGSLDPGAICSGNTCKAGSLCLTVGTLSTCREFCATDMDCAGFGGVCIMTIEGYDGPDDPKFCSDNCDPPGGAGCPPTGMCSLGFVDTSMTFFTVCSSAGTATQGEVCTGMLGDCAPGYGCFNAPTPTCLRYCNMASPNCPTATACNPLNPPAIIGSVEYGVCL
jgi:hypothetical protein